MKNSNKFSALERAAMEQSPANETEIRHNFMSGSDFIEKITPKVKEIDNTVMDTPIEHITGKEITVVCPEVAQVAEAGGSVVDGIFTQKHATLLKSIDEECSVNELIDLRSSLIKATKNLK